MMMRSDAHGTVHLHVTKSLCTWAPCWGQRFLNQLKFVKFEKTVIELFAKQLHGMYTCFKKKIRIRFEVNVECTYWFFASTNIILTTSWCLKITEKVACAASFVNILSGQKINKIKKRQRTILTSFWKPEAVMRHFK